MLSEDAVRRRAQMVLALLLTAGGCRHGWVEEQVDGLRVLSTRTSSKSNGTATARFDVLDGETSFLLTASTEGGFLVHVRTLFGPDGSELFGAFEANDSPYSRTNAGYVSPAATLNWPIDASDASLAPGRYELEFGVVDAQQNYVSNPIFVDVALKPDPSFAGGLVEVGLVFAGGASENADLLEAVDEARATWRDLYDAVGVDLIFTEYEYPSSDLVPPGLGSEEDYRAISDASGLRRVDVVLTEAIDGFEDVYGISGDIPGPLTSTGRSAVLISGALAAGPDGRFSPEERRLLAETMAHEVGHYLGLYHPVEIELDGWDALDDTPECTDEDDCVDVLGANLMFPYPVCGAVSCQPQNELTEEQGGVVNRYTGVD